MQTKYKIGVDVGGTFTDFLLVNSDGEQWSFKTFTTPEDPSKGFIQGLSDIADFLGIAMDELMENLELIVHGTTITTNALITKKLSKALLVCTKGFRDVLEMRRGLKAESGEPSIMYDTQIPAPEPLIPRRYRLPIDERINSEGKILRPLRSSSLASILALAKRENVEAAAVCLLHAYANSAHEREIAAKFKRALPSVDLTVSSEFLPKIGYYDRTSTCALNAALNPLLHGYLQKLVDKLTQLGFQGSLLIMQSNGGVMSPQVAMGHSVLTISSGPAAGPVAGIVYSGFYGVNDVITTDMGGTSFDVSLNVGGNVTVVNESEVSGYKIALPTVDVVSIGAGGGSIAWMDAGDQLHVGPQSAASSPGPACYGRGGMFPTVTDANLVLGYIDPDFFLGGKFKLDVTAAEEAIKSLDKTRETKSIAESIVRIVNANMADAIRLATIKRGFDPRKFMLISAGGAGPLHACSLAKELEIPFILVPKNSSIFCASGMLATSLKHEMVKTYRALLDKASPARLRKLLEQMGREGTTALKHEGAETISRKILVDSRYLRQFNEVSVPIAENELVSGDLLTTIGSRFSEIHQQLYGWQIPEGKVEILNLRMTISGEIPHPIYNKMTKSTSDSSSALRGKRRVLLNGTETELDSYYGSKLKFGHEIMGPAIIDHEMTTILVEDKFTGLVDPFGSLILFKDEMKERARVLVNGID